MMLTLSGYIAGVRDGSIDPQEVMKECLVRARVDEYNAFVHLHEDYVATHHTRLVDQPLCGAPIALKDNILTQGYLTTACSQILEGYESPYDATCFGRLAGAGGCLIGKTNMDEFAMGASSEYSCHGPSLNPFDTSRIAGGSSGGSAVAVASGMALGALGTDTGGSIRLPAALCGLVGIKPTYGRISRYGVMAMASSFDQIGVLTRTVEDSAHLLASMAGHDQLDATTIAGRDEEIGRWVAASRRQSFDALRIALPKQAFGEACDQRISERVLAVVKGLEDQGAVVDYVDMPLIDFAVPTYYTLVPAEVSTNMARYDGMRFGAQDDTYDYESFHEYMSAIRSAKIGPEVKRRILMGSFVLSSAHYEGYFLRAQKVRMQLKASFDAIYADYDLVIMPTQAEPAWEVGRQVDDPVRMYLADIYTAPANLCGLPAISVPCGTVREGDVDLPIGIQLIGQQWDEERLFAIGGCVEKLLC